MMQAIKDCPLCREHEPCLLQCRFEQKREWKDCLGECMKDVPPLRDLMISLSEKHGGSEEKKGTIEKTAEAPSNLRSTASPSQAPLLVQDLGGLVRGGFA